MEITARNLTKHYGSTDAVNDVSFDIAPGHVTGFLGPNGSGKSTTMRLMLGLDHGAGETRFDGQSLATLRPTTRVVGAHLDMKCFHPKRTVRAHLRMVAAEANLDRARVDAVIDMVGLNSVAKARPKGFSLGMTQRLGLATAILADPQVLILDEPANGLDPQSIHWMRDFLRHYAGSGRCVFVSSHLLTEMQLLADHLIVIARGQLIADESMNSFVSRSAKNDVYVRADRVQDLAVALRREGIEANVDDRGGAAVLGVPTDRVGAIAFSNGIAIHELTMRRASLEEAFLELTRDQQDYATGQQPAGGQHG